MKETINNSPQQQEDEGLQEEGKEQLGRRKPYTPPMLLSVERLEAAAATCMTLPGSVFGKPETPGSGCSLPGS